MDLQFYSNLLGVSQNAPQSEIRRAYLEKVRAAHPDHLGLKPNTDVWERANAYIREINHAYSVLKKSASSDTVSASSTRSVLSAKTDYADHFIEIVSMSFR